MKGKGRKEMKEIGKGGRKGEQGKGEKRETDRTRDGVENREKGIQWSNEKGSR